MRERAQRRQIVSLGCGIGLTFGNLRVPCHRRQVGVLFRNAKIRGQTRFWVGKVLIFVSFVECFFAFELVLPARHGTFGELFFLVAQRALFYVERASFFAVRFYTGAEGLPVVLASQETVRGAVEGTVTDTAGRRGVVAVGQAGTCLWETAVSDLVARMETRLVERFPSRTRVDATGPWRSSLRGGIIKLLRLAALHT